jgi:hypothetical protein
MVISDSGWQAYQRLLQRSIAYLATCDDINKLLKLCQQLTVQRLALPDDNAEILPHYAELPLAVRQVEVLIVLCNHYRWPQKVRRLLLLAGFSSALGQAMPLSNQWPKLQRYPALLVARMLHSCGNSSAVQAILAASYPTERHIAPWQQNALSLVLTQAEYLCVSGFGSEATTLAQHIGNRIAVSKSEHELKLLRSLLSAIKQPAAERGENRAELLCNASFNLLCDADNRQLERYLLQTPALATPILALASALNRQQQQVNDIRLALSLLGQAQIPHVLAEAELQCRLLQMPHPLSALYQQFSLCLAHALRLLLPNDLSAPQSRTLALCLCAPLWLNDNSMASGLLKRTSNGWYSALDFSCYHQSNSAQLLNDLLLHYHLPNWQRAVLGWQQNLQHNILSPDNSTLALQLAWCSTLALLTNHSAQSLSQLVSQAQRQQLPVHDSSAWLAELAFQSQCYYPLELTL